MSHRPVNRRPEIAGLRREYEDLRWIALTSGPGYLLTREPRLLGTVYALTPLDGKTKILYSLAEVRTYLNQHLAS